MKCFSLLFLNKFNVKIKFSVFLSGRYFETKRASRRRESSFKMYALYAYVLSLWYPVEEEEKPKKSEKWKIIKGKRYRVHPFSYFYTVFPEYENWKLSKTKKKSPSTTTAITDVKQEVSYRKGGVSFSLDFDSLNSADVKSDSSIPRRFLSTELWNCISRPQVRTTLYWLSSSV